MPPLSLAGCRLGWFSWQCAWCGGSGAGGSWAPAVTLAGAAILAGGAVFLALGEVWPADAAAADPAGGPGVCRVEVADLREDGGGAGKDMGSDGPGRVWSEYARHSDCTCPWRFCRPKYSAHHEAAPPRSPPPGLGRPPTRTTDPACVSQGCLRFSNPHPTAPLSPPDGRPVTGLPAFDRRSVGRVHHGQTAAGRGRRAGHAGGAVAAVPGRGPVRQADGRRARCSSARSGSA